MTICWVNGETFPSSQPCLRMDDLGLQRGYAAFEYLRVEDGRTAHTDAHLARLKRSAGILGIPLPADYARLNEICGSLIQQTSLPQSAIRILLTGGYASVPAEHRTPNLLVTVEEFPVIPNELRQNGTVLHAVEFQRELPAAKSNNYMNEFRLQSLLQQHAANDLLYHQQGIISECPRSNFFAVIDNRLITPAENILHGITRSVVLGTANEQSIPVEECPLQLRELHQATEAFVTSTTKQILPVRRIDDCEFGPTVPGPVTSTLIAALSVSAN